MDHNEANYKTDINEVNAEKHVSNDELQAVLVPLQERDRLQVPREQPFNSKDVFCSYQELRSKEKKLSSKDIRR